MTGTMIYIVNDINYISQINLSNSIINIKYNIYSIKKFNKNKKKSFKNKSTITFIS